MRALLLATVLALTATATLANDIYISQVGDNLDLDITQDGQDNEFGDSTTDVTLEGDDMTFDITQTGDTNIINAVIKGNNYTGTWQFTGTSNQVDLLCSSVSSGNCETVTLDITTNGDDNLFELNIGETNSADSATLTWTIDGDGNVLQAEVDGTNANITVTLDNSATTSTTTVSDLTSGNTTGQGGVLVDIDQDGNGDVNGHSVTLDITGGGSHYEITQSGIYDNTVDGTFSGDDQTVTITQSD
jgi:hypothetical protein